MTDSYVAHLLELRLRARRNREATAIIDRCLALIAKARTASPEVVRELDAEVARIADQLAMRYGAPKTIRVH